MRVIQRIDSDAYREQTLDWRNSASHSIAPRFDVGLTRIHKRLVGLPVEGKSRVIYTLGGTDPLDLSHAYRGCAHQFELARAAMAEVEQLIDAVDEAVISSSGGEQM